MSYTLTAYIWKYEFMIYNDFFIVMTMLTNNSWIFCSPLKFLLIDLLRGDGGTTTWMCHFSFSFYWWHLIGTFLL